MSTKEALYAQFSDVPSRKGRGGTYSYLRWQDVADRMNEVFHTNWSSNVEYQDVVGGNVIVRVRVQALDPTTGKMSFQEGFGGAPDDDRVEAGNNFKAAYSKALKDACKKWGVGLYLDKAEEAAIYGGGSPSPTHTPPASTAPPAYIPTQQTSAPMETPPGVSMETPAGVAMGSPAQTAAPITVVPATTPSTPTPPLPTTPPPMQSTADSMNKVHTIADVGGGEKLMSDVQKAALQSILSMQDVEYSSLVRDAFETNGLDGTIIPKVDELTYTQAVCVVKYGNDKFRSR